MRRRDGSYRRVMVSGLAVVVLALTPTAGVRSVGAGEDIQAALRQEDERPRSEDAQRPRGQDKERPRGDDVQRPRGQEDEKPRGHDRPT